MRLLGLILAGGQARRMGGADKALMPFAGGTLLSQVLHRFSPQVQDLALSANGDPARFAAHGLPVLPDDDSQGPLSGVLAGMVWAAAQGADALVTVPVDGPFLPPDLVPRLHLAAETPVPLAELRPAHAVSPSGPHPTFALWPLALAPALAAFLASGAKPRIRDFARAHHGAEAVFPDDLAFANANTPEDLARLSALAEAAR